MRRTVLLPAGLVLFALACSARSPSHDSRTQAIIDRLANRVDSISFDDDGHLTVSDVLETFVPAVRGAHANDFCARIERFALEWERAHRGASATERQKGKRMAMKTLAFFYEPRSIYAPKFVRRFFSELYPDAARGPFTVEQRYAEPRFDICSPARLATLVIPPSTKEDLADQLADFIVTLAILMNNNFDIDRQFTMIVVSHPEAQWSTTGPWGMLSFLRPHYAVYGPTYRELTVVVMWHPAERRHHVLFIKEGSSLPATPAELAQWTYWNHLSSDIGGRLTEQDLYDLEPARADGTKPAIHIVSPEDFVDYDRGTFVMFDGATARLRAQVGEVVRWVAPDGTTLAGHVVHAGGLAVIGTPGASCAIDDDCAPGLRCIANPNADGAMVCTGQDGYADTVYPPGSFELIAGFSYFSSVLAPAIGAVGEWPLPPPLCLRVVCGANERCDGGTGSCVCADGFEAGPAGCAPPDPCANVACDAGNVCRNGDCVPAAACDDDDRCAPGEVCDAGTCAPAPACLNDVGCDDERLCENHVCARAPACADDRACGAGRLCDDGVCARASACSFDGECGAGRLCDVGMCAPAPGCIDDLACGPEQRCEAGACVPAPGCIDDLACGPGQRCDGGACVPASGCTSDVACGPGQLCQAGVCAPESGCLDDLACGPGQRCDDGTCVTVSSCLIDRCDVEDHTLAR